MLSPCATPCRSPRRASSPQRSSVASARPRLEVVEASEGRIVAGDEVGLSGLQARYDEQLRGVPGASVVARDADDRLRTLAEVPATDGADLVTTLDPALQQQAEDVLAALGEGAPAAALVAIRPSDGAVLASANGAGAAGADLAMTGQYAPGSTFKVVTSLALLRSGMGVDDVVSCPATTVVDGRSFKNYDDYPASALGDITLTQAVAQSCNTALIGNADRLADGDLAAAAQALGLGTDHDLGFPVYFGQVPPPETATGAAADMIGQGTVLASPFAMATVAASVRAGRAVLPVLLPDHQVEQVAPDAAAHRSRVGHPPRADARRGHHRVGSLPPGRAGRGGREDRHRGVRPARRLRGAPDAHVDDRDAGRPRRRGVRRDRRLGVADRRPGARGVPALRAAGPQRRAR